MPIKQLWTLLRLYRWNRPAGIRAFYSVAPHGPSVRVVLMSKTGDMALVFPLSWSCRNFHAWLDDSARILIEADAQDPLGAALATAGTHFDDAVIKELIRQKGRRGC